MSEKKIKNAHSYSIDEVCDSLNTDKYGLTKSEAAKRLEKYGPNELKKEKGKTAFKIFLHQFLNPLVGILFLAAFIVIIADLLDPNESHLADAYVIFGVIIINAIFGFTQEFKAEKAIEALQKMGAPEARVLRKNSSGKEVEFEIKASEIVPGDIVIISTGDRIPADARIIEEMNLHCDEAMLTGESVPVSKNLSLVEEDASLGDRKNLIFSGSLAVKGRAKAIVTNTGMQTEMGKIATLISETEDAETPIKKRINDLTRILGLIALVSSITVFIAGMLNIGTDYLLEVFLFAVAAAVSSIPEGLPIVVTVTLAVAVNRMAKRNAVMRRMQAVDTLGTISAIVSDKTGTLTTNQMTVKKIWINTGIIDVEGSGYEPNGDFKIDGEKIKPLEVYQLRKMLKIMTLCNDSSLRDHQDEMGDHWGIAGDPTEGALVVASLKSELNKDHLELDHPRVDEIGFDSTHKYMATFHQKKGSKKVLTCVKGAPEKVLSMCSSILTEDGPQKFDENQKKIYLETNSDLAKQALRVLGFAYLETKDRDHDSIKSKFPKIDELCFIGFVGMIDPPRPEVKESIRLCKKAGIEVFMATGDHKLTALAIARELGIAEKDEKAVTGHDLIHMSDEELRDVVRSNHVFARVSPEHKYRIVSALQSHGRIVAVTGDGINDAPALKAAEVGVAMGITGTDVTKETADVVLLDDNFQSIVSAVEEGRVVFENIRKVVKYLISTNMGEIFTILSVILLFPLIYSDIDSEKLMIFTAIQILWVNLVTDGPLDIAIAVEPKESNVMEDMPRDPEEHIINKAIIQNVALVAICMAVGIIFLYTYYWTSPETESKAKTIAFITLIYFQIFNALNCRSRSQSIFELGFFKNKAIILAILFSVIMTWLATVVPFLQTILNTEPLSFLEWMSIILVSSSVWIIDEGRKYVQHRRKDKYVATKSELSNSDIKSIKKAVNSLRKISKIESFEPHEEDITSLLDVFHKSLNEKYKSD